MCSASARGICREIATLDQEQKHSNSGISDTGLPLGEIDLRLRAVGLSNSNQFNRHLKRVHYEPDEEGASEFKKPFFQWKKDCKQMMVI